MLISKLVRLFSLFVLLCFLSCSDVADSYPITYQSSVISGTVTRVFTKDGELFDLAKKEDFVNRYMTILESSLRKSFAKTISAIYTSPETVFLNKDGTDYFVKLTEVEKSDLIYWERKDTTDLRYLSTIEDLYLYSPLYEEEYLDTVTSTIFDAIHTKNCFYVIRDGDILKFPVVGIFFKFDYNNELNE